MTISKLTSFASAFAVCLSFAGSAHATGGKAYTWISKIYDYGSGGQADWAVVGADNQSDAYKGDAQPNEMLPLLCILPKAEEPSNYRAVFNGQFKAFYYGWSGAQIGLTEPVRVSDVQSAALGHEICQKHYETENARWAEHHDNRVGGWNLGGAIHEKSPTYGDLRTNCGKVRFMVWIKNQPANPWNS